MPYLIISILFIAATAVTFRISTDRGADPYGVNAAYRCVGGVIAIVFGMVVVGPGAFLKIGKTTWLWAGVGGVLYWLAGLTNLRATGLGHMGVTWTVNRCAMVIPALASLLVWHEAPLSLASAKFRWTVFGLALTVVAIVTFGLDRNIRKGNLGSPSASGSWLRWLAAAFLAQGGWETSLRAAGGFERETDRVVFLSVIFAVAMILSVLTLKLRPAKLGRREWMFGAIAGIGSLIGSGVRPWALRDLPGVLVFPATAVGVLLLMQIISACFWKTKVSRQVVVGILIAVAAVIVLGRTAV